MGLRFRKSLKLFPGVKLNFSKSGVSTSIGGKGLTVNLRGNKTTTTVGAPGTGISYRSTSTASAGASTSGRWLGWALIIFVALLVVWSAMGNT